MICLLLLVFYISYHKYHEWWENFNIPIYDIDVNIDSAPRNGSVFENMSWPDIDVSGNYEKLKDIMDSAT
jgi:hypothetical protein